MLEPLNRHTRLRQNGTHNYHIWMTVMFWTKSTMDKCTHHLGFIDIKMLTKKLDAHQKIKMLTKSSSGSWHACIIKKISPKHACQTQFQHFADGSDDEFSYA